MSLVVTNLENIYTELGEDFAKEFLSSFSCPLNPDVENFLHRNSIEFAKQGISRTHLVFTQYKGKMVLVGYFTLSNKYITLKSSGLSNTTKRRISKFSTFDPRIKAYTLSAPLIAQLGKNYTNGYDKLISGDVLLKLACDKIKQIQFDLGGRYVYLECEDKPKLIDFYRDNGFCEFDIRPLDADETDLDGSYLVQLLKYIK